MNHRAGRRIVCAVCALAMIFTACSRSTVVNVTEPTGTVNVTEPTGTVNEEPEPETDLQVLPGTGESGDEEDLTGDDVTADVPEDADTEPGAEDDSIARHVVVIDPGHGEKRVGACYFGLEEKNLTLKVAQYARDYLLENYKGIDVYLTREDDHNLDSDNSVDLEMRCDLARQVGADCLVSIHFNASDSHSFSGSEVWCSRRDNVHDQTFELAECIMQELEALGLTRRHIGSRKSTDTFDEEGVAYDYYAINRHCAARDVPGIIVEQCFMDSEKDKAYIITDEGLKSLGEANAKGIAAYLQLEPKE